MNDLFRDDLSATPEPDGGAGLATTEDTKEGHAQRRRTALALVAMIVLFGGVVAAAIIFLPRAFSGLEREVAPDFPGPGSGSVTIEVLEGQSGSEIGATLVDAGVVASREAFVKAFNANPGAEGVHAGAYTLMLEMKASDAVAALLDPANKSEVTLTVVEGVRASQVFERIASVTGIPLAEVEAAAADTAAIGLPPEAGGNLEGWLAPATYTIERDATVVEILSQMVAETVAMFDELGVPVENREAVLIQASIAEKEVNNPDDYGKVARVMINRLQPGSPTGGTLGMDSTLAYGLNKSGLDLTVSDLESDTPYNTRLYAGYPPGPIGSPGSAAIAAVLNPPEGDWLYFVTVNPDTGETRFTASYEEHLANQAILREWTEQQAAGG